MDMSHTSPSEKTNLVRDWEEQYAIFAMGKTRHRGISSMIDKPRGIQLATILCVDTTLEDKPLALEIWVYFASLPLPSVE